MTKSQIFLYLCLSFIAGIFIDSLLTLSWAILLGIAILGLALISIFWPRIKIVVIGFSLLFLLFGAWRHQQVLSIIPEINQENVSFTAVVIKEPDIRETSISLTVAQVLEAEPLMFKGKILVATDRYPEYHYGDRLRINGQLEPPPVFEGFNYSNYLAKEGIFAVMSWPEVELISEGSGNPVTKFLISFKNKFQESIRRFISPPQQGFLEALVFGEEGGISKEWRNKLNLTGTRHIVAVSGMNISIIAALVLNVFLAVGFWRKQAFCFSIIVLTLYILMIGAPASAVRAGIMGGILIVSQYLGRMSSSSRALVFAASLMLFLNPLALMFDVGFQLSFLALLGIIYLQPSFSLWLKCLPDPKFFPVKTTLAATLAAQVFTLPVLVYNFGYISTLSPLTNILIVPFLALITVAVFIFGLTAMIFPLLGYFLSWPVWLAVTYIVGIIDVFSKMPKNSIVLADVHWFWLLVSGIGLFLWTLKLNKRKKIW